ncbi:DNA repair protein, putative [Trypanosoma cruzi marinkellei]|uniref:DNA repair protein, putative n=1 Tax=Trypanosoma cruzi marinkellei TaxID=85056 RepID=K2LYF3_TRYCR|nr:DNA repair protein, putative [Trypanosoma cruzi marinkellei]
MAVMPPPWEALTAEDVSRRLAALAASASSVLEVGRCFSRDAVFSTGSAAIDRLLPDGGVACGTVLEIFGPPAAGKSHLVQQMVAAFAARGSVQWTAATRSRAAVGSRSTDCQQQQPHEEVEESKCGPCDWSVFLLVSDPSVVSPHHFHELLKEALACATANSVQCDDDAETLPSVILKRIKLVPFASPNDLLAFFRFLSRVEYVESCHHANRRRVLVVVDNVARLWEHPTCGATNHARHWMAAALVREVRNAILIGNGWRDVGSGEVEERERHHHAHDAIVSGQEISVNCRGGSVAVVFVNGCTSVYHRQLATEKALPSKPLGVPVWLAAAADVRLFVEPLCNADVFLQHDRSSGDVCGTQQSERAARATMRVRLVKGGRSVFDEVTTA